MRLFKRKPKALRQDRIAGYAGQALLKKQRQLADHLNHRTQHWNRASKLLMLLLICLLFGGASLWLLIRAIY